MFFVCVCFKNLKTREFCKTRNFSEENGEFCKTRKFLKSTEFCKKYVFLKVRNFENTEFLKVRIFEKCVILHKYHMYKREKCLDFALL